MRASDEQPGLEAGRSFQTKIELGAAGGIGVSGFCLRIIGSSSNSQLSFKQHDRTHSDVSSAIWKRHNVITHALGYPTEVSALVVLK